MTNSRAKGNRGEREFIERHLAHYWPDACRNLDQPHLNGDKRDIARVAGIHFQIKRVERLELWAALRQTHDEAAPTDLPVLAFRRNRTPWYCTLEAGQLCALLALREDLR